MKMIVIAIIGLIIGIGIQHEYNITNKPTEVKEIQVDKIVEIPVDRIIEIEKIVEVKIKPKSITCEPTVEY